MQQQPPNREQVQNVVSTVRSLLSEGRQQEALSYLDAVLSRPPARVSMLMLKVLLLTHLGRLEEALACINALLGMDWRFPLRPIHAEELYAAYLRKAALLEHLCRYQEAVEVYDVARTLGEGDPMLHSSMGRILAVYLARYPEALLAFYRALEHASEEQKPFQEVPFAFHLMNKGNALSSLARYQEAITIYERAWRSQGLLPPLRSVLEHNMACTLALEGQYAEALTHYRSVLLCDPAFVPTYLAQAEVESRLGHSHRASVLYERARSLTSGRNVWEIYGDQHDILRLRLYITATFGGEVCSLNVL